MFKKLLIVMLITLFAVSAFAENVVEVMGNISVKKTFAYQKPSFKSKALARLGKNSKVLILGKEDDKWLKVRLFNKSTAYVYAKYVTFKYENITKKESRSKALVEIKNLLNQFNDAVQSSWFAEKQKVMPALFFQAGKEPDVISLLYCSVNEKGQPVPSLKENPLQKDMLKLIELVFMKMIVMPYDRYKINIVVPDFISGAYKGRTEKYTQLTLDKNFANIDEIRESKGSVWDYVRSANRPEEIFVDYPH